MPLILTIITQPNKPPSPETTTPTSIPNPTPYQWTILLQPSLPPFPLPQNPTHPNTNMPLHCASLQIFSPSTGGYTRTPTKPETLNSHDLQAIATHWPGYEEICVIPEGRRGEYLFVELDNALSQDRRRWVEVFLEGLVRRGWVGEGKKERVCRGVGVSPGELEREDV